MGFNAGAAAGQTVFHLHVHVIPRFAGDVPDPRGGVRHVIPGKGNYLAAGEPPPLRTPGLVTGGVVDPFLRHVRPLIAQATEIAIVAAFVQESGLDTLEPFLFAALARGARVRVLTGDYLGITQVDALERLIDWASAERWAESGPVATGGLTTRVVEVERLPGQSRSFHPKSWRFEGPGLAVAFVGSSNVSRGALRDGIEWNLRAERERDPAAYQQIVTGFDGLWAQATPLTAEWVAAYAERARRAALVAPVAEVDITTLGPPPEPTPVQQEALQALLASRERGHRRALVVLATGLGKTWLAAFDVEAFGQTSGRARAPRVLVLAHRAELLDQAARTFRRMLRRSFPKARTSWCSGAASDLTGDVVLASVQKLSRPEVLARLTSDLFEYVVVDEVHHADASSYRKILDRLEPSFLLGLTATPERADDGDVFGLFDDHVAFRADLGVGIRRDLLVPFAYHGLKDDVDYANIPWRNHRFDPAELARAVQTQRRMEHLWEAWQWHVGARTLVFCCSIDHATYARDWLRERGVRCEAVHSGPESADRDTALGALSSGQLDALCTVDLFNEGVDLPTVDRVVMLRPTESRVVFLQQLGRGLRRAAGKERLQVLDFVGNHRVFLERMRLLLSFVDRPSPLRDVLASTGPAELPPGCSLDVELEAKTALLELLGQGGKGQVDRIYLELRAARGRRPTIADLWHAGARPSTLELSWFRFVEEQGDLSNQERAVLEAAQTWLEELEVTRLDKSFKLVLLEALLEEDALVSGLPLPRLAEKSHAILVRSPDLLLDLEDVSDLPDPRAPDPKVWLRYWSKNPVAAWTGGTKRNGPFKLDDQGRFVLRTPIPAPLAETLAAMTRELVDYQLARYRARGRDAQPVGAAFECTVLWNRRDPILKLPDRKKRPDVPTGEASVRLQDGQVWQFRFAAQFVNVARPAGAERNQLPDLLRRWFGPAAGQPGTRFSVSFSPSPDGWWVTPVGDAAIALRPRGLVRAFPTLRAAAGSTGDHRLDSPEASLVRLPVEAADDAFAVRACGDSMEGGPKPIRDGDWLLLRFARGVGLGAVAGRVALVQTADPDESFAFQVKRIQQDAQGNWTLHSDNPARPSFPATEQTTPIALLTGVVRPEELAPAEGTALQPESIGDAFGLSAKVDSTGRVDGHLFVLIDRPGAFMRPDRFVAEGLDRRPGETAFVLVRAPGAPAWRYLGVGRWLETEGQWSTPELDFTTWRALGGREVSRPLPEAARQRANLLVDRLIERVGEGGQLVALGKHCRLLGRASQGGLRIDGGDDGFQARTIGLPDLGWALLARDDVAKHGGTLDEARVNKLRYLEGTPKGSTRFIDTGWALAMIAFMEDRLP